MMMQYQERPRLRAICIAVMMLFSGTCLAQVLAPEVPKNRLLIQIEEQFQHGFYALAVESARQYLDASGDKINDKSDAATEKAKYYLALSELNAEAKGSAHDAVDVMNEVSNAAYKQRLVFTLAQYYFKHNDLQQAIPLYESAGEENLSPNELADEKFELAYCYFNDRQFNKAEPLLQAIKELKDGKYYNAGNYYYGLLAYNENKYKEALKSFDRVKDVKEYKSVVPYYIAEIYYFMGNRNKAKEQADAVINRKEKSFYDNELHLLAAQCLFEEQKYADAKPYFQFYYEHSAKIRKEDLYEMAYCDYRTSEWSKAIEKFKMLSNLHDSLGQTSMYLLGDCYLNKGDKKSARNAFGICADLAYNEGQQEASMIIYSKLSYETGYYDESLRQLRNLLKTFPRTEYKDEANTLISTLLVTTNDYESALKHLEEVGNRDDKFKQVYQKATFGYAVQQFRKGELKSANRYFTLSIENAVNADYEDAAYFWKGELAYRLHHYNEVINNSQEFINKKGNKATIEKISPLATIQHAYLNMGFASMEGENYTAAQNYFGEAQRVKRST